MLGRHRSFFKDGATHATLPKFAGQRRPNGASTDHKHIRFDYSSFPSLQG